jgi:hypothetical protein
MARPSYVLQKEQDVKIVKSKEMLELQKDGWVNIRQANEEDLSGVEIKIQPIKHEPVPEIETKVFSPQFNSPEIQTEPEPKIEVKEVTEVTKAPVSDSRSKTKTKATKGTPKDLVCPHCGVKARTASSYKKNHGDNCMRLVK